MEAWGFNLQVVSCEQCDWRYLLPPNLPALPCPHCFHPRLTPLSSLPDPPPPELVIPFSVPADKLAQQIRQFGRGIPFAPGDLRPRNLEARLRPLYWPLWLVDGAVTATWQAEAGFKYEVVNHQEIFNEKNGGWMAQQQTGTRLRWEARLGQLHRTYQNISAPALEEYAVWEQRLGRFDLAAAQPYGPATVEQALVCLPQRSTEDAWPDAAPAFQSAATEECRRACQADQIREFRWSATYQNQHWTLLLLPLYVTYYLDDDHRPQPVFIHGQSGHVTGPRQASLKRARWAGWLIAGTAVALFVGCSLPTFLASLFNRTWLIAAEAGLLIAMFIGLLALVPLFMAWQFNETNRPNNQQATDY